MQLQLHTTKKKHETVWELLRSVKILNVYQINILSNTTLMNRISTKLAPSFFLSKFKNTFPFVSN